MPTLHLICGLPCSGKTTYAKRLEHRASALRLTPDEWHTQLFGHDALEEERHTRHALIEALLWNVAARALTLGVNVILDFGFWIRSEREAWHAKAAQLGVRSELHFLEVSREVMLARLTQRNAELPRGAAYIPESLLEAWLPQFQPPDMREPEAYDAYHYLCPLLH